MPIVRLNRNGKDGNCWILRDGLVNFPKEVVARLGWLNKSLIRPGYIETPPLLLFDVATDEDGVQLHFTSPGSTQGSSASVKSKLLAKVIRVHTTLPRSGLLAIFPTNGLADLALLVEPPNWLPFTFDRTGIQELPKKIGVYQFLDNRGVVSRIGQGNLPERMREHLGNPEFVKDVRAARYFLVKDKDEAEAFEHVLLCEFEQKNHRLPILQLIRA